MPSRFLLGLAAVAGLLLAPQAYATTFSFTYASPDGLSGSVNISGTQSSSGTFDITSGTDTVMGGSGLVGAFTLFQNTSYPTTVLSPSGFFFYDNLLTPNLGSRDNAVHFAIRMAALKSMRVVGCGVRGRNG